MRRTLGWAALAAVMIAAPVAAQESDGSLVEDILQAIRLPMLTREARTLGVPDRDLQRIFMTARARRVRAGSLAELFSAENGAIRKHGPIDNFGAFVQDKLDAGLRGRELAAAIQAEHGARGMGHPGQAGKSMDQGGKPASPGESGKPASPGKPGKPESPGKSGESGRNGGSR